MPCLTGALMHVSMRQILRKLDTNEHPGTALTSQCPHCCRSQQVALMHLSGSSLLAQFGLSGQ